MFGRNYFQGRFAGKVVNVEVGVEYDSGRDDMSGRVGASRFSHPEPTVTLTITGAFDRVDIEDMLYLLNCMNHDYNTHAPGPDFAHHTSDAPGGFSYRSRPKYQPQADPGPRGLPAPRKRHWREVLGEDIKTRVELRKRWRELILQNHPDHGGRHEVMAEINVARDEALRELS